MKLTEGISIRNFGRNSSRKLVPVEIETFERSEIANGRRKLAGKLILGKVQLLEVSNIGPAARKGTSQLVPVNFDVNHVLQPSPLFGKCSHKVV